MTQDPGPIEDDVRDQQLAAYRQATADLEDQVIDARLAGARAALTIAAQQRQIDSLTAHLSAVTVDQARCAEMDRQVEGLTAHVATLTAEVERLAGAQARAAAERDALDRSLAALSADQQAVRASWSWRVTAPLRWILAALRGY